MAYCNKCGLYIQSKYAKTTGLCKKCYLSPKIIVQQVHSKLHNPNEGAALPEFIALLIVGIAIFDFSIGSAGLVDLVLVLLVGYWMYYRHFKK